MNTVALTVYDGQDWTVQFTYTDSNGNPINLTSPRMEVRSLADTAGTVLYSSQNPKPPVLHGLAAAGSSGSFSAGTYFWKITALSPNGETLPSNEETATLGVNADQPLSWAAVDGATGYNIYRGTASGAEHLLTTVLGESTTSYTDTGAVTGGTALPAVDTALAITCTVAANVVTCSIPSASTKNKTAAEAGYWDCYATDPNGKEVLLGRGTFATVPNITSL